MIYIERFVKYLLTKDSIIKLSFFVNFFLSSNFICFCKKSKRCDVLNVEYIYLSCILYLTYILCLLFSYKYSINIIKQRQLKNYVSNIIIIIIMQDYLCFFTRNRDYIIIYIRNNIYINTYNPLLHIFFIFLLLHMCIIFYSIMIYLYIYQYL